MNLDSNPIILFNEWFKEADEYFNSRPLQGLIGTHLSKQSQIITGDFDLAKAVAKRILELIGRKVERPKSWSGFCVIPEKIEFWQKGDFRIHRRQLHYFCNEKLGNEVFVSLITQNKR
jgi:pyridoxine/pyridoxamine 5'-phosphate oxidase